MSVAVDTPAPGVARIRIDRPHARNAVDTPTRYALLDALGRAREDEAVRAIVLGGMGGMFCAGGDLPSMVGLNRDEAFARLRHGHEIVTLLWECRKPVVAAVERFAIGAGAGLALTADDVVTSAGTRIGFPFQQLGLVPDWGIAASLRLRAGWSVASRLLRDSAAITGEQAVALGIADHLVAEDAVMAHAIALATTRAAQPAGAFGRLKALMRGEAEATLALQAEAEVQAVCITSPEFAEGYAAFREKRAPRFTR